VGKTKAASLRAPSALMSPPTSGVYGEPELARPISETSSARKKVFPSTSDRLCRRSWLDGAHPTRLGSPVVGVKEKPSPGPPKPKEPWSREWLRV